MVQTPARSDSTSLSVFSIAVLYFVLTAMSVTLSNSARAAAVRSSITQGPGEVHAATLLTCDAQNARISPVGTIRGTDGRVWTVPAETAFAKGPKAADLYNACNNFMPGGLESFDSASVPVVEVDEDGEIITGYLFADNYFELYVNGKLVAVDPVPYVPLNSAIVRFKAKRPLTYAVKLVDWEDNMGLGTERGANGNPHQPGNGGFIARFSDGTVTDASWKAQTFYIAPLSKPTDVVERAGVHDTSKLGRTPLASGDTACGDKCYGAHYRIPTYWYVEKFDDRAWPAANEYTENDVDAYSAPAYTAFQDVFSGAHFIWSGNLVYDNVVLIRKVVAE